MSRRNRPSSHSLADELREEKEHSKVLSEELETVTREFQDYKESVESKQRGSEMRVDDMDDSLDAHFDNDTIDEFAEELRSARSEIIGQREENRDLRETLDRTRAEFAALSEHYDSIQSDNMSYQIRVQRLEGEAMNAEKEVSELQVSVSDLEQRYEQMESERDSMTQRYESMEAELAAIAEENGRLAQELANRDSSQILMGEKIDSLESLVKETSAKNEELINSLSTVHQQLDEKEIRVARYIRQLTELKRKYGEATVKLHGAVTENEDLKQELTNVVTESELETEKMELERQSISEKLEQTMTENENLRTQSPTVRTLVCELQASRKNNEYLVAKLQSVSQDSIDEIEMSQQLRSENAFLKAKNRELKREIRSSQDENMTMSALDTESSERHSPCRSRTSGLRSPTPRSPKTVIFASEAYDDEDEDDQSATVTEAIPQILETVRELKESVSGFRNNDVIDKLGIAIQRLERLKASKQGK